jgi:putative transcriptional regulator
MARHRVSGKALADELGVSTNAVSALRTAETMPKINGQRLDQIAAALTKLSEIGGIVRGIDLLEDRGDA